VSFEVSLYDALISLSISLNIFLLIKYLDMRGYAANLEAAVFEQDEVFQSLLNDRLCWNCSQEIIWQSDDLEEDRKPHGLL